MNFSIGVSALRASQTAISVIGNNIANAATEGYHRKDVLFVENPSVQQGSHRFGTGVSIGEIRRATNANAEAALTKAISDGSSLDAQLQTAQQVEALFVPGTGTVQERMEQFFNDLERLSAYPTDASLRSTVIKGAELVTDEIRSLTSRLNDITTVVDQQIGDIVGSIEGITKTIAGLNAQITEIENQGGDAHALIDQRQVLVDQLAQFIDVERRSTADGRDAFFLGGGMFAISDGPLGLSIERNDKGILEVWKAGCDKPISIVGGTLAGLLSQNNDSGGIEDLRNTLDSFVTGIIQNLDSIHATGVGMNGSFRSLTGNRDVASADTLLNDADTAIPLVSGDLYISVTEASTGNSVLTRVAIDPASQSLNDVAAAISSVTNLAADVDDQGKLTIVAASGYTFDFTGSLQTLPDPVNMTGTSRPEMTGSYTGSVNDTYSFTVIGSGTVGVSPGLQIEVKGSSGKTIQVLNVGEGYEPGAPLLVGDGVFVNLTPGSLNADDQFEVTVVGQPDESGLLAAMGMNTFFAGKDASNIRINPQIAESQSLFATTKNGDPSDTRNLLRMINLREERVMRNGSVTLEQYLAEIVTNVGQEVNELSQAAENGDSYRQFVQEQVSRVSGVDVNEELAKMLQMQRSFQAAARYITTLDELLQELFNII